jgi:hypothetical protein
VPLLSKNAQRERPGSSGQSQFGAWRNDLFGNRGVALAILTKLNFTGLRKKIWRGEYDGKGGIEMPPFG